MRTSKKSLLIQAALEIIDKKSLDALTYDSLAKASGMSKSGLLYHLPSRAALLLALNEHLASSWRASLLEAAGAPPEELSPRERLRAVVEVLSQSATRADLLLALDTHTSEEGAEVWDNILGPWLLPREEILADPDIYLLYIIADGLWVHDHINSYDLTTQERRALISAALAYLDSLPDLSHARF